LLGFEDVLVIHDAE